MLQFPDTVDCSLMLAETRWEGEGSSKQHN